MALAIPFFPEKISLAWISRTIEKHPNPVLADFEREELFLTLPKALRAARKLLSSGEAWMDTVELTKARRRSAFYMDSLYVNESTYDIALSGVTEWNNMQMSFRGRKKVNRTIQQTPFFHRRSMWA